MRAFSHSASFIGVHGHRLFTKNGFTGIERRQRHLAMRDHRRDDADKIDIIASDQRSPIAFDLLDSKFARYFLSMFTMRAANRDDARAFTVLKSRNLGCPREPSANNSYPDCLCDCLDLVD